MDQAGAALRAGKALVVSLAHPVARALLGRAADAAHRSRLDRTRFFERDPYELDDQRIDPLELAQVCMPEACRPDNCAPVGLN
jgi:hypothetical protein